MAFNINQFLNAESKKELKSSWKPVKINVKKLRPASDQTNFYHAEDKEIKDLAKSIELIGLQQYPVVRPIEGTDEYEVIAGHKRRLALLSLLHEGKSEYEMVPCKVETPDDIRNELILIFTNSTQRERTDYEKMREIERVRELLIEYQKTHELTGRRQSIIAEILGTSKTKIGTLDKINSNLVEPFKEEFAAGKISTSTASEIAGLQQEAQRALYDTYQQTGCLTAREAKSLKELELTKPEKPDSKGQQEPEGQSEKEPDDREAAGAIYMQQEPVKTPQKTTKWMQTKKSQELKREPETPQKEPERAEQYESGDEEENLRYQAIREIKELASFCAYLTEDEIATLQEIVKKCRERAGMMLESHELKEVLKNCRDIIAGM